MAFRRRLFEDKKNNKTQDGVEVNCSTINYYPIDDSDDIASNIVDQQSVILPGY